MTGKPANTNRPCPICGAAPSPQHHPFCSPRCADMDLHRWLGGVYRVETEEAADESEFAACQPPRNPI